MQPSSSSRISTLNSNTSTEAATPYKWLHSWLQINNHVIPYIKFNESENIWFAVSRSYNRCLMYVSLRHLNQIGLYHIDFAHVVSADLRKQFKSYVSANEEQLKELKLMIAELQRNLPARFVELDENPVEIHHLVNLQEFHMMFLKRKLYMKNLGREFSRGENQTAFVSNYEKILKHTGGLMVIKRPDNGATIIWPFHEMPGGRQLGCDNCITLLAELFTEIKIDIYLQTIEDQNELEKIANFYRLMLLHLNEEVVMVRPMNTAFVNLKPYLAQYKDHVKLLCRYDDTFPGNWLEDFDKLIAESVPQTTSTMEINKNGNGK
jgi:hypothetical protein